MKRPRERHDTKGWASESNDDEKARTRVPTFVPLERGGLKGGVYSVKSNYAWLDLFEVRSSICT